jgi:hypothetical protein
MIMNGRHETGTGMKFISRLLFGRVNIGPVLGYF